MSRFARFPHFGHVALFELVIVGENFSNTCPECGKMATRQLSGGAGLVFKGSGFYITDYKRAGEKKTQEAKSESKPADSKPKPSSTDK